MRLTIAMKESLFNIIKNQTQNPFTDKKEVELEDRLAELILSKNPAYAHYIEAYKNKDYLTYTDKLIVRSSKGNEVFRLYVKNLPHSGYLYEIVEKPRYYYCIIENNTVILDKDFEPLIKEILALAEEVQEYLDALDNLKCTINSCNTDKQLSEMYPEFIKYFNKAGIVQKANKQVPSVLGLPQSLTKFGLVLESQKESIEEEIRKEIQEEESKDN